MAEQQQQGGREKVAREKVALVSGASGITGRYLLAALDRAGGWGVVSLARGTRELPQNVQQVHADLTKRDEVESALREAGVRHATHLVHCAVLDTGDAVKGCEVNGGMLRNLVEGAEASGCTLEHVYCMEGTKWYGETFHDYLEQRMKEGAKWTWSALRPNPVRGFSQGSFMNITTSIAVYASVCKELGLALRFPGSVETYNAVAEVCDAEVLANAIVWTSTQPQCANQGFNVSNGDVFRWREVWPKIAKFFEMEAAPPVQVPLQQVKADKGEVWQRLVKRHGLQVEKLGTWKFADFVLSQPGDWFSSVQRLRRTGFHGMCVDSDEMFCASSRR